MPGPVRRAASASPRPRPACEGHERTFDRSARPDYARHALAICGTCRLLDPCRSYALTHDLGPVVVAGLRPSERRAARRHAGIPDDGPTDLARAYTLRQQVADTDDPHRRRALLAQARDASTPGVRTADLAAELDVDPDELRRAHSATLAARRRRAKPMTPTPPTPAEDAGDSLGDQGTTR